MAWTIEEIERDWLRGGPLELPADEVLRAFAVAEEVRGRDWMLSHIRPPGGGERSGHMVLWPVFWFGVRMQSVAGAIGIEQLVQRLPRNDSAAESELTAMHLLRAPDPTRALEIEPEVIVGAGIRRPDFKIRGGTPNWIFAEVTQLNRSTASDRAGALIRRIANAVVALEKQFVLEVVLGRELTEDEENETIQRAREACDQTATSRHDVGDFASVLVKTGDPTIAIPTTFPDDAIPRAAIAMTLAGPGAQGRQIIVRVPFADQRAEDVLSAEARQLPQNECGLVMVDVTRQATAFESWSELIPPRFTAIQHTRVAGVLLFMCSMTVTAQGLRGMTYLKLLPNLHARAPLPTWIGELVERVRAENRRLTGQAGE